VGLLVEGGLSNPHVVGGAQAVPDAFVKYLREQGSDVVMGTMADKILLEGKKAVGVRVKSSSIAAEKDYKEGILEPKEIKAKYVISNAAARQTFDGLVGRKNLPAKFINNLERMELTPTFCALFLGLNMDLKNMGYTPALHVHSSTYNIDEHFRNIDSKIANENAADTFFRFQLAPLSDPTSAPEGKTAFVMHGIPAPVSGWNDPDFEKRVADVMVKRAEKVIPGLSKHIEYQEFCSPVTLDKYLMCGRDASLGWALTPQQVGPKRLSPKTPIKNLFLSGHWTGPAVGVASAVISGLKTASMILKEEGVKEPLSDVGVIDAVVTG
jgi:prolycopene isomerase